MNTNPDILTGKICPYCGSPTEYTDSLRLYGRSYGMIYICWPCGAHVGVHQGTDKALGRLATAELRRLKMEAHKVFDPLWERKMRQGFSKKAARHAAYKWLSEQMGLPIDETHIGMFDEAQCRQVIDICKNWKERNKYPVTK